MHIKPRHDLDSNPGPQWCKARELPLRQPAPLCAPHVESNYRLVHTNCNLYQNTASHHSNQVMIDSNALQWVALMQKAIDCKYMLS